MDKTVILEQNARMESNIIVISRTTEERLTKNDLEIELDHCNRQIQQTIQQSKQIKLQYDSWIKRKEEINTLLSHFSEDELITL